MCTSRMTSECNKQRIRRLSRHLAEYLSCKEEDAAGKSYRPARKRGKVRERPTKSPCPRRPRRQSGTALLKPMVHATTNNVKHNRQEARMFLRYPIQPTSSSVPEPAVAAPLPLAPVLLLPPVTAPLPGRCCSLLGGRCIVELAVI